MNNIELIKAEIISHFTEVSSPSEGMFRAAKKREDDVYQVHYIDITQRVLKPDFDLDDYQRKLLLKDFYSVEGALQWNFYLHFIVEEDKLDVSELENIRHRVETDKKLARKYVSSYDEFKQYLNPLTHETENPVDLIDQWEGLLETGLGDVLDENVPITSILKSYFHSLKQKKSSRKSRRNEVQPFLPIQKLDLVKYRKFPLVRSFHFGMVNLISGPNAVGKTSLLEALELVVCGKTMRNPDSLEDFLFRMKSHGADVIQEVTRENEVEYRSRDHYWYGRNNYVRGNELHNSFSRFNFFDADAAVRFSERIDEGGGISKALTQVVFGPDADKVYERIEKLKVSFETHKKTLSKSLNDEKDIRKRIALELDSKSKADAEKVSQEAIKKALKSCCVKLDSFEAHDLEEFMSQIGHSSVFLSSWKSANQRFNVSSYASFGPILAELKEVVKKVQDAESEVAKLIEQEAQGKLSKINLEHEVKLLERLKAYMISGAIEIPKVELNVAILSGQIESFEKAVRSYKLFNTESLDPDISISDAKGKCKEALVTLKKAEDLNTQLLAQYKTTINQVDILIKEVRLKGCELVKRVPEIDECPLCGTVLKPEKLANRIVTGTSVPYTSGSVDQYIHSSSKLSEQREIIEEQLKNITVLDEALNCLKKPQLFNLNIIDIIKYFDKLSVEITNSKTKYSLLKQKLEQNVNDGYSLEELNEIYKQLEINKDCQDFLENGLDAHIELTRGFISDQENNIIAFKHHIEEKKTEILKLKSGCKAVSDVDNQSIAELLIELERLYFDVNNVSKILELYDEDNISSVDSRIVQAKELISSYLRSLAEQKSVQDLSDKLEITASNINNINDNVKKANTAIAILNKITQEKSPEIFLTQFLEKYSELISSIFNQIHSPREFEGVVFSDKELFVKRRTSGEKAPLSELSTGQRTALVLSVFLSMNKVIKNGPPLLIFDDPVTYVDDLNVLSFLDYLQRLSLEETRQIFFATANQRISSIFEKKFEFLKTDPNGFKEIRLSRGEKPVGSG